MYADDSDTEDQSTERSVPQDKTAAPTTITEPPRSLQPRTAALTPAEPRHAQFDGPPQDRGASAKQTVNPNELRALASSPSPEKVHQPLHDQVQSKNQLTPVPENQEIKDEFVVEGGHFIAVYDFIPEKAGDLQVAEGNHFTLIETRDDGWWKCSDATGNVGLVPKNVLQHVPLSEPSTVDDEMSLNSAYNSVKKRQKKGSNPNPRPAQPEIASNLLPVPQGKFKKIDKDDHYGLVCHLFPRLSGSNLHFHDVYWLHSRRDNCLLIRKRKVKFCKIIKVYGICPTDYHAGLDVHFYLYDKRTSSTGRQIVSNVLTANIRVDANDSFSFFKGSNICSFVLRSNYNLSDVVLRAEVSHQGNNVGYCDARLLTDPARIPVNNGKITVPVMAAADQPESKQAKLIFQFHDIPTQLVGPTDGLPDVLLCQENRVPLYYAYRNLVADYLGNCDTTSTWISDPVISTFPVAATDPDLMDLLTRELEKIKTQHPFDGFRKVYINTILPIIMSMPVPESPEMKDNLLKNYTASLRKNQSAVQFLSNIKCKPVDPFDYVVDLTSIHSLD